MKKNKKAVGAKQAVKPKAKPRHDAWSAALPARAYEATLKYKRKETIFRQGDPADAVFLVKKGKVKIAIVSEQGKEAVVAFHQAGDLFGLGCLAGQALHLGSAVAIEESAIVRVGKENIARWLRDRPAFARSFMAFLLARHVQVESDMADLLFNSSERRLARTLLVLADFRAEAVTEKTIPKIGQDVLAARVGTTRSRVSYFMNKFRRLGYIEYDRGLRIHATLANVLIRD
jgi:CRP/FNR family transcriptional regulator, cyclic AMP receptor protein